jgi:hypothetical protein
VASARNQQWSQLRQREGRVLQLVSVGSSSSSSSSSRAQLMCICACTPCIYTVVQEDALCLCVLRPVVKCHHAERETITHQGGSLASPTLGAVRPGDRLTAYMAAPANDWLILEAQAQLALEE